MSLTANCSGHKRPAPQPQQPVISKPIPPRASNQEEGPQVTLLEKGIALFQQREFSAAEWHLEEALRLSPRFGAAYYWLARLKNETGDHDRALDLAERAGRLLPKEPSWAKKIQALKKEIREANSDRKSGSTSTPATPVTRVY